MPVRRLSVNVRRRRVQIIDRVCGPFLLPPRQLGGDGGGVVGLYEGRSEAAEQRESSLTDV